MTEHPILFNGPMVKAILDDRKTQTRRVIRPQPTHVDDGGRGGIVVGKAAGFVDALCPLGMPGDRLWVRETWRPIVSHHCAMNTCDCGDVEVRYSADGGSKFFRDEAIPQDWSMPAAAARGFVPSIHMPRWACRLVLEITEVRVHRLQDIDDEDALAEGINRISHGREGYYYHATNTTQSPKNFTHADSAFADLWRSVYGPAAWSVNPWVWAVSFRRAG